MRPKFDQQFYLDVLLKQIQMALKGGDLSNEIKGYKTRLHSINKWLPQTYFNQKFIVEIKLF